MLKGVVNKAPGNQAEGFILKVEAAGSHGRVWSEWCGDAGRKRHRLH